MRFVISSSCTKKKTEEGRIVPIVDLEMHIKFVTLSFSSL